MSLWPTRTEEGRAIRGAQPMRRISVLSSSNWSFILNYPDFHVRNAGFSGPWESESFGRRIRFVQFSVIRKHNYDERQSGDWLHQKEAEYTEWRELVPRRNPGGPHKSEVKERILFHLQLLFVSCLAGRNGRRTGQDHKYQKCFRGESEECYNRLCRRQRLDPEVRIEIDPESEAVRRSFKTRRRAVSILCFGR